MSPRGVTGSPHRRAPDPSAPYAPAGGRLARPGEGPGLDTPILQTEEEGLGAQVGVGGSEARTGAARTERGASRCPGPAWSHLAGALWGAPGGAVGGGGLGGGLHVSGFPHRRLRVTCTGTYAGLPLCCRHLPACLGEPRGGELVPGPPTTQPPPGRSRGPGQQVALPASAHARHVPQRTGGDRRRAGHRPSLRLLPRTGPARGCPQAPLGPREPWALENVLTSVVTPVTDPRQRAAPAPGQTSPPGVPAAGPLPLQQVSRLCQETGTPLSGDR